MRKFGAFVILFFFSTHSFHAAKTFVELENNIKNAPNDTTRINFCLEMLSGYSFEHPEETLKYGLMALDLSGKIQFKKYQVHYWLANLYIVSSNYSEASKHAFNLLNDCKRLKGVEKLDYTGRAYEILASINRDNKNLELATKYQMQAIEQYKKIKGDNYYIVAFINLANMFHDQQKTENALYYYNFVLEQMETEGLQRYYPYVYNGMAGCYEIENKLSKALQYYELSKKSILKYTPDDASMLASVYNNIGNLSLSAKNYLSAILNCSEAHELFTEIGDMNSLMLVKLNLANAYRGNGNFQKSNDYYADYVSMKDSLFTAETRQTIHDVSIKYQADLKEKQADLKEQQNKLLKKDNEQKQQTVYFAFVGVIMLILFLIFIFNRLKVTQRQKEIITLKEQETQRQKNLVDEKNKEILQSITYAQRLQQSILPPPRVVKEYMDDSFVIYLPKDIVAGDFYWLESHNKHIYFAAADCTGHGVPGAMVAMVCYNALNRALLEFGLYEPSLILDKVNEFVEESFSKGENEVKDGMDISLCALNKEQLSIEWTGANNPLWIVRKEEGAGNNLKLLEFKPDKQPVGRFDNRKPFTNHRIQLQADDCVYIFTDGYADQFGGERGKKYTYKRLREILLKINHLPLNIQKEQLLQEFNQWKGDQEQVDDVCVIGIRIN